MANSKGKRSKDGVRDESLTVDEGLSSDCYDEIDKVGLEKEFIPLSEQVQDDGVIVSDEESFSESEASSIDFECDSSDEAVLDEPQDPNVVKAWGNEVSRFYSSRHDAEDPKGGEKEETFTMEQEDAEFLRLRLLSHLSEVDFIIDFESGEVEFISAQSIGINSHAVPTATTTNTTTKYTKNDIDTNQDSPLFPLVYLQKKYTNDLNHLKDKYNSIVPTPNNDALNRLFIVHGNSIQSLLQSVSSYYELKEQATSTMDNHPILSQILSDLKMVRTYEDLLNNLIIREQCKQPPQQTTTSLLNTTEVQHAKGKKRVMFNIPTEENFTEESSTENSIENSDNDNNCDDDHYKTISSDVNIAPLQHSLKRHDIPTEKQAFVTRFHQSNVAPVTLNVIQKSIREQDHRPLTYEMKKNVLYSKKAKKMKRNPRVKNKMKYQKAVKRNRAKVKQHLTETTRYGGERNGIRKNIIHSVKLV